LCRILHDGETWPKTTRRPENTAQPVRVADFSVKGSEQPSPAVASVCSVSRILIHVRFIAPSAISLWSHRTLVHAFPEIFPRRSHSPRSFPRNIPRRSREPALARPPLSAMSTGGRTTSLSKQSLRTCNVDNELRQALVLLRCPPILADWRTTINAELAH